MNAEFRKLFAAHLTSQLGFRVAQTALPLTALATLGGSASQVALLVTVQTVGFLLVGLPAGAWVDRWPKIAVLTLCDAVRAVVVLALVAAWATDTLALWHLYGVAFVIGTGSVFFDVAVLATTPRLLDRSALVRGNARLSGAESAAAVAGPLVAGAVAWVEPALGLILAALAYAVSSLCLVSMRRLDAAPVVRRRAMPREVVEGLRFVVGHRAVRRVAVASGVFNLCWSAMTALFLALLLESGTSGSAAGAVMACFGLGGVVGASVSGRLTASAGRGRSLAVGLALSAPFALLAGQTGRLPAWVTGVALFGVGVGVVSYNVAQISMRQRVTPTTLLGRVNATMRFLVWGTIPLGSGVASALASRFGPSAVVIGASVALCCVWPILLRMPEEAEESVPRDVAGIVADGAGRDPGTP
ncbi:MFS transporter [Streptomyces sp. WMMC905]|uniref:MFS transporter n=1 Tax=Streptomyces sp. WMMC905 TaxID=3404123 RepID=UPI003B955FAC